MLIRVIMNNVNLFHAKDWSKMSEFIIKNLPKFERSFSPVIEKLRF